MNSISERKNIYFASDFHLGIPSHEKSLVREKLIVKWLDEIKHNAKEIYLMGDIFDFWFEYSTVVPKGFVRLFGKLIELTDAGISVFLYKGNHDMWAFDYFEKELNIKMFRNPEIKVIHGKRFYLAHGDGLGSGDLGYKFIKKVFESRINQALFKWIHPDLSIKMALFWSRKSRYANVSKELDKEFIPQNERLYKYAEEILNKGEKIDYFIFGHRHIPTNLLIGNSSRYVNLGDWIVNFTYAVFDGDILEVKKFN